MHIQELGRAAYEAAQAELVQTGHKAPLCAFYTVRICVDSNIYRLSLQPMRNSKIAVLQAVWFYGDHQGQEQCRLLTAPGFLKVLLDLWLSPIVKKNRIYSVSTASIMHITQY